MVDSADDHIKAYNRELMERVLDTQQRYRDLLQNLREEVPTEGSIGPGSDPTRGAIREPPTRPNDPNPPRRRNNSNLFLGMGVLTGICIFGYLAFSLLSNPPDLFSGNATDRTTIPNTPAAVVEVTSSPYQTELLASPTLIPPTAPTQTPPPSPVPTQTPLPIPTPVPTEDRVNRLIRELDIYWTQGRWNDVINILSDIRTEDPNYPEYYSKLYAAYFNQAILLCSQGIYEESNSRMDAARTIWNSSLSDRERSQMRAPFDCVPPTVYPNPESSPIPTTDSSHSSTTGPQPIGDPPECDCDPHEGEHDPLGRAGDCVEGMYQDVVVRKKNGYMPVALMPLGYRRLLGGDAEWILFRNAFGTEDHWGWGCEVHGDNTLYVLMPGPTVLEPETP